MAKRVLNFDLSTLSLNQMAHLVDALNSASDVLSGLQEQPRFWDSEANFYNAAGQYLEDARVALGFEIDAIVKHAATITPSNDDEAGFKFFLVGWFYHGMSESPGQVVKHLARIAADIEWERQHPHNRAAQ